MRTGARHGPGVRRQLSRTAALLVALGVIILLLGQIVCAVAQPTEQRYRVSPNPAASGVVKQKLHAILARPEYASPNPEESSITRDVRKYFERSQRAWREFTRWTGKWYDRLKEMFSFGGKISGSTGLFFIWLFIAVCVVSGGYLLAKYLGRIRNSGLTDGRSRSYTLFEDDLNTACSRSAEDWVSDAKRLAQNADYRHAIRALFLASLIQLEHAGLLEYSRSSTNGDFLVRLAQDRSTPANAPFRRLVHDFELTWYGEQAAGSKLYDQFTTDYALIIDLILNDASSAPGLAVKSGKEQIVAAG